MLPGTATDCLLQRCPSRCAKLRVAACCAAVPPGCNGQHVWTQTDALGACLQQADVGTAPLHTCPSYCAPLRVRVCGAALPPTHSGQHTWSRTDQGCCETLPPGVQDMALCQRGGPHLEGPASGAAWLLHSQTPRWTGQAGHAGPLARSGSTCGAGHSRRPGPAGLRFPAGRTARNPQQLCRAHTMLISQPHQPLRYRSLKGIQALQGCAFLQAAPHAGTLSSSATHTS